MSLLFPIFLVSGLLVGLPIVLHLLRKKPRRSIAFPSLRFLGPVVLRETKRQRILRWLVLALRCTLIALVAMAFARPFLAKPMSAGDRCVIIAVDNSFSMQSPERWPALLAWTQSQITGLSSGDQAGILLMNPTPTWLVPITTEIETVRSALNQLQPGWQSTRYRPALQLAGETLRALPFEKRELIWMADQQRLGWRGVDFTNLLPPGVVARFAPTQAAPQRQAAIVGMLARGDASTVVVDLVIQPFLPSTDTRTVILYADNQPVANETLQLEAGRPSKVTLRYPNPGGVQLLKATLDPDDLLADDTAYAVFNPEIGIVALLADSLSGDATDFIAHALAATSGQDLEQVRGIPIPTGEWPGDAVAVMRGSDAFKDESGIFLTKHLQNGGGAWIMLDGSPEQSAWLKSHGVDVFPRPASGGQQLRDLDLEHPLFAVFADGKLAPLLSLDFNIGWSVSGGGLIPLARWSDKSIAVAEIQIGNGLVLLTGFEPSRRVTNMPLTAAFVPFVHRAVEWLAQSGQQTDDALVGNPIQLSAGKGLWSSLDAPATTAPVEMEGVVIPQAPGLYQFQTDDAKSRFAVNLSPDESDLAPFPKPEELLALQSSSEKDVQDYTPVIFAPENVSERQSGLWWWLLFLTAIILLFELKLSNKAAL